MSAIKQLRFAVLAASLLAFIGLASSASSGQAAQTSVVQVEVKHVSAANFQAEVENSKVPVIVDFYATWCGPCKLLKPNLEKIAAEFGGKIKVVKVDVDASSDLASRFGVNRYPTMLTFKDGKQKETLVGYRSVEQLRVTCNELLK